MFTYAAIIFNCAGPLSEITEEEVVLKTQFHIVNFGTKPKRISCASIALNCTAIISKWSIPPPRDEGG